MVKVPHDPVLETFLPPKPPNKMRTFLSPLLLGLLVLLSACTRVVFPEPLGKPVPSAEVAFLVGEWLGEEESVWVVSQEPGSEYFTVKSTKKGKKESHRFLIRTIGQEDRYLLWVEDPPLKGYTPLRVAGADEALALLYPDTDAVEKMIAAGKLQGVLNKDPKAWLITKGDWEEVLAGKDFWLLDNCQPFVRRPQPPAPSPTAPPTPEALSPAVKAPTAPSP
jgi:hypothetical protein